MSDRGLQSKPLAGRLERSAGRVSGRDSHRRRAGAHSASGRRSNWRGWPASRGRRHLCRKLSRARDRQDSRPEHRPGRHRAGRRRPHGRIGRPSARGCLQGGGPRYHHATARHDDRRRQSAAFGLLCCRQCLGQGARQAPFDPARRDRRDLRRFFRLPGERCDLPGAGPARSGVDARAGAPTRALPAGRGNGVECRINRDDHRQPAEHHDRQLLSYPLHQVRPGVGAGRAGRADHHRGAHRCSSIAPSSPVPRDWKRRNPRSMPIACW